MDANLCGDLVPRSLGLRTGGQLLCGGGPVGRLLQFGLVGVFHLGEFLGGVFVGLGLCLVLTRHGLPLRLAGLVVVLPVRVGRGVAVFALRIVLLLVRLRRLLVFWHVNVSRVGLWPP